MNDKQLSMQNKLIKQSVNRLRRFGFENVNERNIATDEVYRMYFLKILKESFGKNEKTDVAINRLIRIMSLDKQKEN